MKTVRPQVPRRRGRPRSFDRDAAVQQAMLLFWRYGYESTSVAELTKAMKITAPSLYAAYGDKKGLFLEAVRRYTSGPVTAEKIIEDAPTARAAAEKLMLAAAAGFSQKRMPAGCLLATAAISCSQASQDLQLALSRIRQRIEARLLARIKGDIAKKLLPQGTQAHALASLSMAVIQGMSTLARDGASSAKLTETVKVAMTAWPRCAESNQ